MEVFVVLLFISVALSQQYGPSFNEIPTVSFGEAVSISIPISTPGTANNLLWYKIWVPENVSIVATTAKSLQNECSTPRVWVSDYAVPCSPNQYSVSNYSCSNTKLLSFLDYNMAAVLSVARQGNSFSARANSWWYFAIGKHVLDDSDSCSYNFTVSISSTCPTGQVAGYYESPVDCFPYTVINGSATGLVFSDYTLVYARRYKMYKIEGLPNNVGSIVVRVNTSSTFYGGVVYGSDGRGATAYSNDYTSTMMSGSQVIGGRRITNYQFNSPSAGDFYFSLYDTSDWIPMFSVFINPCSDPFTAGFFCNSSLNSLDISFPQSSTVELRSAMLTEMDPDYYNAAYFYFDTTENTYLGPIVLNASIVNGTGSLIVRRNGFPVRNLGRKDSSFLEFNSSQPAVTVLNQFNFMPGRTFIGVLCLTAGSNGNCRITLSTSPSPAPPKPVTTGVISNAVTTGTIPQVTTANGFPSPPMDDGELDENTDENGTDGESGTDGENGTDNVDDDAVSPAASFVVSAEVLLAFFLTLWD